MLVVGAGITGALIAYHLARDGMNVCVIDRREAGWGSTAASTALLQYEIDTELQDLQARYGLADAVLAYKACESAIGSLRTLAKSLRRVEFQSMRSLYFASRWYHKSRLESEGALRRANGFELQMLDRAALVARYGIDAPVGLLTSVAAQTDPYQMAHRLLGRVESLGGRVHARTALQEFKVVRGGVRAETDEGVAIRAKQLIFAAGYESEQVARPARGHATAAATPSSASRSQAGSECFDARRCGSRRVLISTCAVPRTIACWWVAKTTASMFRCGATCG